MIFFPNILLLPVSLYFIFFLHPSASQSNPEGVPSWVKDKDWRCDPCNLARWRECHPMAVADDDGGTRTKVMSVLRNCICLPDFESLKSTLYCDRNEPELLKTTKAWLEKECCHYPTCKESPAFEDRKDNRTGVPCWVENDLVIVLDSSQTFADAESYEYAREFVEIFASEWLQEGNMKYVRLAIVAFDEYARVEFTFDYSKTAMLHKVVESIHKIPFYGKRRTNTKDSIRVAHQLINNSGRKAVRRTILQVTDALWTAPDGPEREMNPRNEVNAAKRDGIRLFAIGAGRLVQERELVLISGDNPDHATKIKGYENTPGAISMLSRKICYGGI